MSDWIKFAERRPAAKGHYRWRVPSAALEGRRISFIAQNRARGAGLERVISPEFDYWDGWNLNYPSGLEWLEIAPDAKTDKTYYTEIEIEGIELAPCPFCKRAPEWGVRISARIWERGDWQLKCCSWAAIHYGISDPIAYAAKRNAALGFDPREQAERLREFETEKVRGLQALLDDADFAASVVADAYAGWSADVEWVDYLLSEIAHRKGVGNAANT